MRSFISHRCTRARGIWLAGWGVALMSLTLAGCSNRTDPTKPVVWQANDRQAIAEPEEETDGKWFVWDGTHKMLFYRVGNFLNLGRTFRWVGTGIGVADPTEAGNINNFDEVPDSTWFDNRHFFSPLSQAQLAQGAATGPGLDTTGSLIAIGGKESAGSTPGFVIKDPQGEVYLIKFDPPSNPEMTTASEVIGSRILYAAGYNVPENYLTSVKPEQFKVDPKAEIEGKYRVKRPMTETDVKLLLERIPHQPDGTIRAMVSKFLPGIPKGPFLYEGRRDDDVNDRIRHENRRELRGLRVIAAFMNHTDTKAANALSMYDPEKRYLTHYLIDFSSTLGADNADPQLPRYGNEYFFDFGTVGLSTIALGAYVKPWEVPLRMSYPSVGYFESERFEPDRWRPTFPNPAFLRMTRRDAYWGAKIVTSFTDEDIETIVKTGGFTDPRAERYMIEVLKGRRDKIGRYYLNEVNPLDRFELKTSTTGEPFLVFENLALSRGYAPASRASYRYTIRPHDSKGNDTQEREAVVEEPRIPLSGIGQAITRVQIKTSYDDGANWSDPVTVFLAYDGASRRLSIIALERKS